MCLDFVGSFKVQIQSICSKCKHIKSVLGKDKEAKTPGLIIITLL